MASSDVIVVGAGPVGLTLALVVGRAGVAVTVLEACETSNPASRASTVHASTLELMHELGIAWDAIRQGTVVSSVQYRSRKRGFIAQFDFGLIADYTRFPIRLQTEQRVLSGLIRGQIEALSHVDIRYNSTADGVRQDDDGVEVTYHGPDGAGSIRGRYVVAADGAHSAIRQALGIGFAGAHYESRYLTAFTTYNVLEALPELAPVTYISDDDEALSVIVLPDHTRLAFHLHERRRDDAASAAARIQDRLARFLPPIDGEYPVADVLEFSISRRIADRFRDGRVVLAGDSAHLNSPTGGMGMNSGIHDAYMLGKMLTAILSGEIAPAALDGYAAYRRAVAVAYVQQRAERNLMAVEERVHSDDGWGDRFRHIAGDRALSREFLLKASMFDTAPRVGW